MNVINKCKFIRNAQRVHNGKYDYSDVDYINNKTKVIITCPIHGKFLQRPKDHELNKQGCPKCGRLIRAKRQQYNTATFIQKSKEVHGDEYDYSKVDYINNKTKVIIICRKHGEFKQIPQKHYLNKQGCPKCGYLKISKSKLLNTEIFIQRAKAIYGNVHDYSKVDYIDINTRVIIICPIHGEFRQRPHDYLNNHSCPTCGRMITTNKLKLDTATFIQKSKEVHGDEYDYSKVDYINNRTKVIIICRKHGEFKQIPNAHTRGHGCPSCNSSKGEIAIVNFFDLNKINYIREYRLHSHRYRYDFYLPDYRILIEYDGAQHFKPVKHFGGKKALKKRQQIDKIKNRLAVDNHMSLIRIKYTELDELDIYLRKRIAAVYVGRKRSGWFRQHRDVVSDREMYKLRLAYREMKEEP